MPRSQVSTFRRCFVPAVLSLVGIMGASAACSSDDPAPGAGSAGTAAGGSGAANGGGSGSGQTGGIAGAGGSTAAGATGGTGGSSGGAAGTGAVGGSGGSGAAAGGSSSGTGGSASGGGGNGVGSSGAGGSSGTGGAAGVGGAKGGGAGSAGKGSGGTANGPLTVKTISVDVVGLNASVTASVTGSNNASELGIVWATTPSPTVMSSKRTVEDPQGLSGFSLLAPGLEQCTKYYVRAHAISLGGDEIYANELTFITPGLINDCVATYVPVRRDAVGYKIYSTEFNPGLTEGAALTKAKESGPGTWEMQLVSRAKGYGSMFCLSTEGVHPPAYYTAEGKPSSSEAIVDARNKAIAGLQGADPPRSYFICGTWQNK